MLFLECQRQRRVHHRSNEDRNGKQPYSEKITAQKEDFMRNHAAQKRALNEGFSSAIESAVWLWCIKM